MLLVSSVSKLKKVFLQKAHPKKYYKILGKEEHDVFHIPTLGVYFHYQDFKVHE